MRLANGGTYSVHLGMFFTQKLDHDANLDHETGNMTSDPHIPSAWHIVSSYKTLVEQMNESV